ncbi:Protein of unknown function [Azospirillum sp. RU38E]|nr:Protein of unknown function [Azospirillum sp. RU38E]SNS37314.1 Protein of unknown function [Azospirillum sp. RU37A]
MALSLPLPLSASAASHGGGVVRGTDPSVLASVGHADTALALWERQMPDLMRCLAALPASRLPSGRVLVRLDDAPAALAQLLGESPLGDAPLAQALLADMLDLTQQFAAIAQTDRVDIRLDKLAHNACWKFHRDHVRLRLLATYRGPQTQIVPPCHSAWAMTAQRAYRGPLEELAPGTVALFKGACAADDCGIVHRSPPIAGMGITRLLLCLNLPSAASPVPWEHGG